LHPGAGGNPAFKQYDLDNNMKKVFWPAVAGWIILGCWIASLFIRYALVHYNRENRFQIDLEKK
jgi:heme exporter protein C